jgi:hypothetical protein
VTVTGFEVAEIDLTLQEATGKRDQDEIFGLPELGQVATKSATSGARQASYCLRQFPLTFGPMQPSTLGFARCLPNGQCTALVVYYRPRPQYAPTRASG